MALIDSTYFENTNIVANVNEPDPNYKVNSELDLLINKGERNVLSFAFGIKMWNDFKQYSENGIPTVAPQNYIGIIKGKEYQKNGKDCFWMGLVQEDIKESLLADYVYCLYHSAEITQTTGIGEVLLESKVGSRTSSIPKITKTWNKFIEKLHGGFRSHPSGFILEGNPYWYVNGGVDYYGVNHNTGEVSLIQFLFDNKEQYPLLDTNYRRFGEFKNELGI